MLLELSIAGGVIYAINKLRPRKKKLVNVLTTSQSPRPISSNRSVGLLREANSSVQRFKAERLGLFFNDTRRRQMEEITQGEYVDPAQPLYWEFKVSLVNMGIALTSLLFYPPLIALTIPGLIVGLIPTYRHTYQRFKNDRVASSYLTDIILFTGLITGGYLYAASFFMPVNLLIHILIRKTEDHSKRSLTNLFGEQPRSVWVLVDDVEVEIPFEQLERDAIIVIRAGQMIPIDGTIIAGTASIDQHRLTGESQPV